MTRSRPILAIIIAITSLCVSGYASAQPNCNIDFQDRQSLDANNPYAKYGFVSWPPGYTQHCSSGDITMVYDPASPGRGGDLHVLPEDPAYWNCFGSGPSGFAFGHCSNPDPTTGACQGVCQVSPDPNAIPRRGTSHLCSTHFKFTRADGGLMQPWSIQVFGTSTVNVVLYGTDGNYWEWSGLSPGYTWGLTAAPVDGTQLFVTCWGDQSPYTVDNFQTINR
jgi:hypothetical protein